MRKAVMMLAVLFTVSMAAQQVEPTLEKVGKMVKATYYHDNGTIAQTGYILKGKLHGQWFMYNTEGKKLASGKYNQGLREGKWLFWKDDILKEVDFVDNKIAHVKNWNQAEIVSIN